MIVECECPNCNHEFDAKWDVEGSCPKCDNRYQWCWDELGDDDESCMQIWESDTDGIKDAFLLNRDYLDRK